jgi:SPP1 family predicted phage head-tail adaptor
MRISEKPFNPGELRTSIILKTRTVTTGTGGFQFPGWSTLATVFCKWVNAHGSEVLTANMAGAEAPATVTIRYRSDVDPTYAVEKGGELWEIVSMDNIREKNELIELKVRRMRSG